MYEKNGRKYFIVDGHTHFWDGSAANRNGAWTAASASETRARTSSDLTEGIVVSIASAICS